MEHARLYSEADFEFFFAPHGWRAAQIGDEIWQSLLHAKFHPHRCNNKDIGQPKLKFLLRYNTKIRNPLRDFHEICSVCTSFQVQDALIGKIWMDLLKGLRMSYGGFNLRGSGFPQICSAS